MIFGNGALYPCILPDAALDWIFHFSTLGLVYILVVKLFSARHLIVKVKFSCTHATALSFITLLNSYYFLHNLNLISFTAHHFRIREFHKKSTTMLVRFIRLADSISTKIDGVKESTLIIYIN